MSHGAIVPPAVGAAGGGFFGPLHMRVSEHAVTPDFEEPQAPQTTPTTATSDI
jgi:hypothetical protein